ncbi:hypothetical protein [Erwinia sp. S38]|uniref:hypothetical protein n=1 Tax=Erwinia sp. S38 TaxID=2769338 RepID=UPI00190AB4C5|nr:hypothetical protein [Erwinia sp. S38]MBK0004829.1 hypothetical protein [Erwinia sp. S38]
MIFERIKPIERSERESFCQNIAAKYRFRVKHLPFLSLERIEAQKPIMEEIKNWIDSNKLSETEIIELNERIRVIIHNNID